MSIRFASRAVVPESIRRRLPPPAGGERAGGKRRDSEHTEQVMLFNRIRTLALNDARYALAARRTFAIPNGGGRSKAEAGRLRAEGVTAGVSDIMCAIPRGVFHGLFIEMKSMTGFPSKEQRLWLAESVDQGYCACCCRGANEAWTIWRAYVDGKDGVP